MSEPAPAPVSDAPPTGGRGSVAEIAGVFLRLGCLSFGGPIAHLGYLRAELVVRRRWLDDAAYADLVALCQFLPGPASSQAVFGLGLRRAGLAGALVASLCFTLPSALLMIAAAYGVAEVTGLAHAGWRHGLMLAAVAVVAQAVWGMGRRLCPDLARAALALAAAALLLVAPGALTQLAVLAAGALVGWRRYRGSTPVGPPPATTNHGHRAAVAALVAFAALLALLPALTALTHARPVAEVDGFYRAGSLVFGGGHVVLPLLRAEVVPPGWLTDEQFLTGYAAAQAVPGPVFTLSAYLGAAMHPGPLAWLAGLRCLGAIFLPAWLLIGGALPFWDRLRRRAWAQAALAGASAAVVGVLLAALYRPVIAEAVVDARDVAVAVLALAALEVGKAPPWLVVGACAGAGQLLATLA